MLDPSFTIKHFIVDHFRWFLLIVCFLYIAVAYKSSGYHQEDEHYQIIEFANYKLGLLPENRLAWEFSAQIRPGFQPLICYFLLKTFHILGISNGYTITFLLRSITAVVSILVIWKFVQVFKELISISLQPYFIFFSFLLWFLPYSNVRFSSECWSGLFFLLALAVLQKSAYRSEIEKFTILGLLLGISILFRYQSALLAAGIFFWLLIVNKAKLKNILTYSMTLTFTMCLGVLTDYWLYGEFTFTLYNYLDVNIIKGVSAGFGVSPFYEYLYYTITAPGPFGIVILLAFIIVLYYDPKNVIIWAILPFLLIHSMIPHKELRFLFPIINTVPFFLVYAFQLAKSKPIYQNLLKKIPQPTGKAILVIFFIINCIGLLAVASTGAGTKRTVLTEWIHRNYGDDKLNLIIVNGQNPYMDWGPPKNTYYSSSKVKLNDVHSLWQEDLLSYKRSGYKNLVIISDNDITGRRALALMKNIHLVKVYQNIPEYLSIVYALYDPEMNDLRLNVYEFR